MLSSIVLLSVFALGTVAQSTTTTVSFFYGYSITDQLVGSVIAADASRTTYAFRCTKGGADCNTALSVTATAGSDMMQVQTATQLEGVSASVYQSCSLGGTTTAVCDVTVRASANGVSTAISTISSFSSAGGLPFYQIPITAGAEKLDAAATATAATSSASSQNAAPTAAVGDVVKVLVPVAMIAAGVLA